jgi:hypothetical protein
MARLAPVPAGPIRTALARGARRLGPLRPGSPRSRPLGTTPLGRAALRLADVPRQLPVLVVASRAALSGLAAARAGLFWGCPRPDRRAPTCRASTAPGLRGKRRRGWRRRGRAPGEGNGAAGASRAAAGRGRADRHAPRRGTVRLPHDRQLVHQPGEQRVGACRRGSARLLGPAAPAELTLGPDQRAGRNSLAGRGGRRGGRRLSLAGLARLEKHAALTGQDLQRPLGGQVHASRRVSLLGGAAGPGLDGRTLCAVLLPPRLGLAAGRAPAKGGELALPVHSRCAFTSRIGRRRSRSCAVSCRPLPSLAALRPASFPRA